MKDQEKLEGIYQKIEENTIKEHIDIKRRVRTISMGRISLFLLGLIGVILFFKEGWMYVGVVLLVTLIPFLWLVKYHNRLFLKKEYLEKKTLINREEIAALNLEYSSFNAGKEFINPQHLYTYDLDIFGDHSFFQYINRTCTEEGQKCLAAWLNEHLRNKKDIIDRQESIQELAQKLAIRQHFRITGLLCKEEQPTPAEIKEWLSKPTYFLKSRFYNMIPTIVTVTNIILFILAILNILPYSLWGGFIVTSILFSGYVSKKITAIQFSSSRYFSFLFTSAQLLSIMEKVSPESNYLQKIKSRIENQGKNTSEIIGEAASLLESLDQRNNILLALFLNGLFLWEIRKMKKIEKWKEIHAAKIPQWLESIGEFDALSSLSTFAYNHPEYSYPIIENREFVFDSSPMGHPLIRLDKFIKNEITIPKRGFFLIITGANMAGKSTYLRTAGINYLMACIGLPVCSEEMRLYPSQLVTSLRTTDSLKDNESYFFAELKRLKLIIDKLNQGEELFIILDEILKGTNSIDKQKGSLALVKQLIRLRANGIIATHDLALGNLKDSFPHAIRNHCFEANILENELFFSYRLNEGVAQNMNACFLMNKMGITEIEGD